MNPKIFYQHEGDDMEDAFKVPVRKRVHPFAVVVFVALLTWVALGAMLMAWGM